MLRILFLFALLSASFVHAQNLEWKGFADLQFQMNRGKLADLTTPRSAKENGFLVNQGALYLSTTKGKAKFLLDLPFRSPATASQNTFRFAEGFAQAYVNYTADAGWSFKAGQFDTPYGFEGNDTTDIILTNQGIVFAFLPVTHMGLLVSKAMGALNFDLLVGNGQQKTPTAQDDNSSEVGLKVGWSNETYRARVGALMNMYDGEYTASVVEDKATETLVDVGFGGTWGAWSLDLAYNAKSNVDGEAKRAAGDKDPINGLLAQLGFAMNDDVVAIRFESISNFDSDLAAYTFDTTSTKLALGYQHTLKNENLKLKAEVATNSIDDGTESQSFMTGALAGVMSF